jgi:putative transposase
MPVDRKRHFESAIVPHHEQIDPRLKEDMAVLHLAGLSTRTLAMISKRLLGVEVSGHTVSQSLDQIKARALEWLTRPISEEYWALFIDGTHFRIQRRGSTEKEPSLVVLGIDTSNRLSILAIEPGTKDNADAWEAVFSEITKRGLNTSKIKIGIMDGLPGLESLFRKHFPYAVTARCWVHALKNALAKVPARLEKEFKEMAHKVMYASGEIPAREAFRALKETMGKDAERAVHCLEKDLDSLVAHYKFDPSLWRTLRTTNPIERVNKEFKRRAKSMETMGEKTLNILLAFTALRLEFNWKRVPLHSRSLQNLIQKKSKTNSTEATIDALFH